MRGHIRKRGAKWSVVVDVGRDEDGKRRQKWHSGFARRKDAEAALAQIVGAVNDGTYVAPSKLTLREYLEDRWLPTVSVRVRPTTYRSYAMLVRTHIVPTLGHVQMRALTADQLDRLYGALLANGSKKGKGPLSPRSVRYVHVVLKHALADAVNYGLVAQNVAVRARNVPKPSATRNRDAIRAWDADELRAFLHAREDDRLYALWRTLATTGARRGEVLGLAWDALDLDAGTLEVRRALVAVGYRTEFSPPKTDRSRRSIALDADTVDALKAHRKRQREERFALGPAWQDSGLVFVREDGAALHPDRVSKLFDAHVAELGGTRIRLHDLRHTHATLGLRAGVHVKVMSERLGHSSVSLTLDTYSHAVPGMEADAAARIAALI